MSFKVNQTINLKNNHDKVYCHEAYAQDLYNVYCSSTFESASFNSTSNPGDVVQIQDLIRVNKDELVIRLVTGEEAYISLRKEKKFFTMLGIDTEYFINTLSSKNPFEEEFFKWVYVESNDNFLKASFSKAQANRTQNEFAEQLNHPTQAYVAKVISKNGGGYLIDVLGVDGFLPGSLAAPNKILDFEAFIGKEVNVMVESYLPESNTFIFSHKKYISHILPSIIASIREGDKYTATVTGSTKFGIFCEFKEMLTGLLHKTEMLSETEDKFTHSRFTPGDTIEVWVKQITPDNKIILTQSDPQLQIDELTRLKSELEGSVRPLSFIANKHYGYLFQVTENQMGLLSYKDAKESGIENELNILTRGEVYTLTISKVNPETGKIFLKANVTK